MCKKLGWKAIIFSVVIFFGFSSHAFAFCFVDAGNQYGVSPQLLWSIAKVESNFNPKAINHNTNGSYDFGVMQINSSWASTLGRATWEGLADPCMNVMVGAWVLSNCIQKYGNTWEAVGCYNARSKDKRAKYARKIHEVFKKYGIQ